MQYVQQAVAAGLLLAAVCGCRYGSYVCPGSASTGPYPIALDSDEVARQAYSTDASAVPTLDELDRRMHGRDGASFRELDEETTHQLAAAQSVAAGLLLQESDAVAAQSGQVGVKPEVVEITRTVLATRAAEERNKAAAGALELLLRLAEAQDGWNRLAASQDEVAAMLADLARIRAQGLAAPISNAEIERQRLDLVRQQHGLHVTIGQLERQLADLLSLEPTDDYRIWPKIDLTVNAEPIDRAKAVAVALVTRADLAGLCYIRTALDARTLPAIQQALGALGTGLGVDLSPYLLLGQASAARECETDQRRGQLEALFADRERTVLREVRAAIEDIEARLRQVAASKQQLEVLRGHVENLRQRQASGAATLLDVRRARLDVVKAEQQLVSDVIQWKIAVVKLKAAQGLLAAELGYCAPTGSFCGASPCNH